MTAAKVFSFRTGVRIGVGTGNPAYTLDVDGSLNIDGPIDQRGAQIHADFVFETGYALESIEDHAQQMWESRIYDLSIPCNLKHELAICRESLYDPGRGMDP